MTLNVRQREREREIKNIIYNIIYLFTETEKPHRKERERSS